MFSKNADEFRLIDRVEYLESIPVGTFFRLPDGRILAVGNPGPGEYCEDTDDGYFLFRSEDGGTSWKRLEWNVEGEPTKPCPTGAFVVTNDGTLIMAYADLARKHWTWDDERKDAPGSILPNVVMRSVDGGDTWIDVQTLHTEWTGATRDAIVTKTGRIVFSSMMMRFHPARHCTLTYASSDDGVSWQPSNIIDLGGHGHHDGAIESTILEVADGRLVMFIRTMWGCFWLAESLDDGRYWHPLGPTPIPASSAPCILKRLASGRIVLVWNLPYPAGSDVPQDIRGGDCIWAAVPTSNYRKQISISFSDDECRTWTDPVAIAESDREITYPQVFEPEPGRLWITAHRWNFRVGLNEADFID